MPVDDSFDEDVYKSIRPTSVRVMPLFTNFLTFLCRFLSYPFLPPILVCLILLLQPSLSHKPGAGQDYDPGGLGCRGRGGGD